MRGVYWTLSVVLIATACLAQTQQPNQLASAAGATMQEPSGGTRGQASVATGERTVVGCVAIASPGPGYILKTEDGRTLNLRGAATDLAPYMGKKVQIRVNWTTRGVHVASPLESGATPAAPAAAPTEGTSTGQQFAGDVHLEFQGKVLGDCLGKKRK
jgi:hypothetical protein